MNILVSNDDGWGAFGLDVLIKKLKEAGHRVCVVVPDSNRSAVSHHITMYNSSILNKVAEDSYTCSGYPVDCVCIGVNSNLFDFKFDCVISGINRGGNLGTDIIYSGTCAAARQGVLNGYPAIAVSCEPYSYSTIKKEEYKYDALADFVVKNLDKLIVLSSVQVPRSFVNINGAPIESYKGVKFTSSLCVRDYGDSVNVVAEEDHLKTIFVPGNSTVPKVDVESDYTIVHDGYIAVSVIEVEPCGRNLVEGNDFSL